MHPAPPPMRVENASKLYQGKPALKEVSLVVQPGEIFGLIGLNGAGKTTLMKIILDLLTPDSGSVELYGHPTRQVQSRRQLSYLPEKFQPSRYLKGYEFLDLCLSYYKRALNKDDARRWAVTLDLDPEALARRVGTYSKGMGQKLGLVGAFMVDAPLLLLDEPMSGLDPRARIRLKEAMLAARGAGKTLFFSSHILSDVDALCDRIGVLHEGRLLFCGTPEQFKSMHGAGALEDAFLAQIALPAAA